MFDAEIQPTISAVVDGLTQKWRRRNIKTIYADFQHKLEVTFKIKNIKPARLPFTFTHHMTFDIIENVNYRHVPSTGASATVSVIEISLFSPPL